MRVKELGLAIDRTSVASRIAQLYRELDAAGIRFHPPCYLSDEWACPEGVPAIGIPFFLAHPRLRKLERRMMREVEGGSRAQCMRILRHEAGHAIDHAFRLHRRDEWRAVFGRVDREYRDVYRVRPYSTQFVRNLRHWYAQMHPEEDFAETFAVWLDPDRRWRDEYEKWGALEKLTFVEEIVAREVVGRAPEVRPRVRDYISVAARMRTRLGRFYRTRRSRARRNAPGFTDHDLRRIFDGAPESSFESAGRFMRRRRRRLLASVSRWGGEGAYTIATLLERLTERVERLGLHCGRGEAETLVELSSFLTTLVVNHRYARLAKERR
jgi:hypothetical protein